MLPQISWIRVIPYIVGIGLYIGLYWYGQHQYARANEAISQLSVYEAVISNQVQAQKIANANIEHAANGEVSTNEATHITEINTLTPDVNKLKKDISNEYETRIANLRDANRMLTQRVDSAERVPQVTQATSDTESGSKCDATLARLQTERESLESACAIETSDFNAAAQYIETVTKLYPTKE